MPYPKKRPSRSWPPYKCHRPKKKEKKILILQGVRRQKMIGRFVVGLSVVWWGSEERQKRNNKSDTSLKNTFCFWIISLNSHAQDLLLATKAYQRPDRGWYDSIKGGRSLYCLHFGFSQFMRPEAYSWIFVPVQLSWLSNRSLYQACTRYFQ